MNVDVKTDKTVVGSDEQKTEKAQTTKIARSSGKKSKKSESSNNEANFWDIANAVRERYQTLSWNGTVYIYDAIEGIYHEDGGKIEAMIQNNLDEWERGSRPSITHAKKQIYSILRGWNVVPIRKDIPLDSPWNQHPQTINVKNGVLIFNLDASDDEEPVVLVPHSPEYRFSYCLPIVYDPEASIEPVLEYFDTLKAEPSTQILAQVFGHLLLSSWGKVYKKAYYLNGPRDSGKSTFIELVSLHFLTTKLVSGVSLHELLGDKFAASELYEKVANVCADLPSEPIRPEDLGKFKKLTGGDLARGDIKHARSISFVNRAVFIFSANQFPYIRLRPGDDTVFFNRFIVADFTNAFPNNPDFAKDTFTPVFMSGLLNVAIDEVFRIHRDGLIDTPDVTVKWLASSNYAYKFLEEEYEKFPGAIITHDEIYRHRLDWCNENHVEWFSEKSLHAALKLFGAIDTRKMVNGNQVRVWAGIKKKDSIPVYPDPDRRARKNADDVYQKSLTMLTNCQTNSQPGQEPTPTKSDDRQTNSQHSQVSSKLLPPLLGNIVENDIYTIQFSKEYAHYLPKMLSMLSKYNYNGQDGQEFLNNVDDIRDHVEIILKSVLDAESLHAPPNVSVYIPMSGGPTRRCIHKGCNGIASHVDPRGLQPLCRDHYDFWVFLKDLSNEKAGVSRPGVTGGRSTPSSDHCQEQNIHGAPAIL